MARESNTQNGPYTDLYFDTAATTPLSDEVRRAIIDHLDVYGNPSSLHRRGVDAENALRQAREQVLRSLHLPAGKLVFTGGGTEANNLALFGTASRFRGRGKHVVTTQIEHPSVLEAVRHLEREGWSATYVAPKPDGSVDAQAVLRALRDDTVLVSVMHVNNETGAILPVVELSQELKKHPKVLFHVDGIQAFGKMPFGQNFREQLLSMAMHSVSEDVEAGLQSFGEGAFAPDLYTLSGHKIGAMKGIGALYIREGLQIDPILYGGGQENGYRSGTENVLGAIALGVAAMGAHQDLVKHFRHVRELSVRLREGLRQIPGCRVASPPYDSPYIIHASFPGLKGEVLVHAFESEGLFVSTGSACSSRDHSADSHVLKAMGYSKEFITGAIRFSLGRWHCMHDVDRAIEIVKRQAQWLASMSQGKSSTRGVHRR